MTSNTPPSLESLQKLQLFRTTLVSFMDWRNFRDAVVGYYVRVLLEMRGDEQRRDSNDHYYIALVKDTKKGPTYTGFTADAATTELHLVIEMPPCFRSTPNSSIVQFNSVSNSPFRQSEYQQWVQMTIDSKQTFPSIAQLQFRTGMLEEQKQQVLKPELQRRRKDEDPEVTALRERQLQVKRETIEREILATHVHFPRISELKTKSLEELQEMERELLDLMASTRGTINERAKCMVCHNRLSTAICYPCKHQVLCRDCSANIVVCPVAGCHAHVDSVIEPFTT